MREWEAEGIHGFGPPDSDDAADDPPLEVAPQDQWQSDPADDEVLLTNLQGGALQTSSHEESPASVQQEVAGVPALPAAPAAPALSLFERCDALVDPRRAAIWAARRGNRPGAWQ